jgi:hypothetical protein
MSKARTSVTLSEEALHLAKLRREGLGYSSISEYCEFLILVDAQQKPSHLMTRDENGVRYYSDPQSTESETEKRITVRLLDPSLESALARYCAHKRRKKTDVLRTALVELLEAEGFLKSPEGVNPETKEVA